jgi:hypothetical protein
MNRNLQGLSVVAAWFGILGIVLLWMLGMFG